MQHEFDEYTSVLAANYLRVLGLLLGQLRGLGAGPCGWEDGGKVPLSKISEEETSWSVGSILVAAVMFESWMQYVILKNPDKDWARHENPKMPRNVWYVYANMPAPEGRTVASIPLPDMSSVVVARDALAHNHIWTIPMQYSEGGYSVGVGDHQQDFGGDQKFQDACGTTGTLRGLEINSNPAHMHRGDVKKVLRRILEAMQALCANGWLPGLALTRVGRFGSKDPDMTLEEMIASLGQESGPA